MDIADIQTAVESFIDSILPSISELLLLLLVLLIILGTRRSIALLKLLARRIDRLDTSPLKRLERAFDVKKFRAFIAIFIFLLFARSVHLFAYQVGNLVPGNISYSQPALLLNSAPGIDIAKVWSLYPKAESIQSLNAILDIEVQQAKLAGIPYVEASYASHEDRYIDLMGRAAYLKFLLFYIGSISICFQGRSRNRQIIRRSVLLTLLILILIGHSFLESAQALTSMNSAKVKSAIYIKEYEPESDKDETETEVEAVDIQVFENMVNEAQETYEDSSPFSLSFRTKI